MANLPGTAAGAEGGAILLAVALSVATAGETPPGSLYDGRRWFELRDAIREARALSLYRGAVASAFNEVPEAERHLKAAIQSAPDSEEADEARRILAYLYARLGRYGQVVRQFDEMLKRQPSRPDVHNARTIFAAFSRYPNQSVARRKPSAVRARISAGGITIPLSVNGKPVDWLLDTAFTNAAVSEAEARMLGLAVQDVRAQAGDLSSGVTNVRTAVAARVAIGGTELRNVALLVLPDSQPPMDTLPPGERGILGLPVVLALEAVRWGADGSFEIGFPSERNWKGRPNMCFDGATPLTRVEFEGKELDFILDTGNGAGTQLWTRFANDFTALVKEHGTEARKRVTQIGGERDREVVVLPSLRFRIGGFDTTLRPANVFAKPVGNDWQHGLLGMDLLSQAHTVTIDFRSMVLTLE